MIQILCEFIDNIRVSEHFQYYFIEEKNNKEFNRSSINGNIVGIYASHKNLQGI